MEKGRAGLRLTGRGSLVAEVDNGSFRYLPDSLDEIIGMLLAFSCDPVVVVVVAVCTSVGCASLGGRPFGVFLSKIGEVLTESPDAWWQG